MTEVALHQEAPVGRSVRHMRRFWAATAVIVTAVMGISAVVAITAGWRAGRLVLVAALLCSSAVAIADGVVARQRHHRQNRRR